MNESYIVAKSLICALGDNKQDIVTRVKNLNQDNYEEFLLNLFNEKKFYFVDKKSDEKNKFTNVIKKALDSVLEKANLTKEDKEELYIFIGSTSMGVSINEEHYEKFKNNKTNDTFINIGYNFITEFVENYVGTKNKALIFSTACTSSVNAFNYASNMIKIGKINKALVLGVEFFNQITYDGFKSFMLLSNDGVYRPFDKNSYGLILGEGCSAIILDSNKRTDNDFRYVSSANICDNFSETTSDTTGEAIFKSLDKSINKSGLNIKDIDLLKAHMTGTENNNLSESNAFKLLFSKYSYLPKLTAVKPYIGHTLGACGLNEIILLIYLAENNFFPATLGFIEPLHEEIIPIVKHESINESNGINILFNFVAFGGNNTSVILSNKRQ